MEQKSKGFTVKIIFKKESGYSHGGEEATETLENITEIHYSYDRCKRVAFESDIEGKRVAFESDIEGTGYTYAVNDIAEFEAILNLLSPKDETKYKMLENKPN